MSPASIQTAENSITGQTGVWYSTNWTHPVAGIHSSCQCSGSRERAETICRAVPNSALIASRSDRGGQSRAWEARNRQRT